jgi:hypothetical protein
LRVSVCLSVCLCCTHLLAGGGLGRQERPGGPRLIEVLENADGLREREAVDQQRRHRLGRVQRRIRLVALPRPGGKTR